MVQFAYSNVLVVWEDQASFDSTQRARRLLLDQQSQKVQSQLILSTSLRQPSRMTTREA